MLYRIQVNKSLSTFLNTFPLVEISEKKNLHKSQHFVACGSNDLKIFLRDTLVSAFGLRKLPCIDWYNIFVLFLTC